MISGILQVPAETARKWTATRDGLEARDAQLERARVAITAARHVETITAARHVETVTASARHARAEALAGGAGRGATARGSKGAAPAWLRSLRGTERAQARARVAVDGPLLRSRLRWRRRVD